MSLIHTTNYIFWQGDLKLMFLYHFGSFVRNVGPFVTTLIAVSLLRHSETERFSWDL